MDERVAADVVIPELGATEAVASEARFRLLVEQSPLVVYTHDGSRPPAMTYVSPQVEQMLGIDPARWLHLQIQTSRPIRCVAQRRVASSPPHRRRHLHRQIDVDRSHQPRPGDHILPNRLTNRRPPIDGFLAFLRPGIDER